MHLWQRRGLKSAVIMIATILSAMSLNAAPPEKYAASSMLAKGKWVKIDVTVPGLQTLTPQTLKNFGFSNPKGVYVYGYGGQMISEVLTTDHPDDLPAVPFIVKDDGSLMFYATGFSNQKAATTSGMAFDHVINPYCETSYYFLSDVAPESGAATIDLSETTGLQTANTFICQKVHERDLIHCATSGREYFGEDFKSNKSQEFEFDLPDNVTGDASIRIRFATNTASQTSSSITVSANGQRLAASRNDVISGVTASDQYYNIATTIKKAEKVGNNLKVGINYQPAGVVSIARLDWIEVEYEREIVMRNDEIHFQVNPTEPTAYTISGASESTIIWDVTEPWNIKEVKGNYDSATKSLTIALQDKGFRDFIAFEPAKVKGTTITGRLMTANQDIHGLPTPDMVIISPEEFSAAAERIADLHRNHDGMTVHVLTPEKIYNEFSSGNADLSAFRKLLKMWYDRSKADPEGTQFGYCLLMGRPTYDQKRKNPELQKTSYPTLLIWQSPTGLTEASSYCTDDFIAMLEDETSSAAIYRKKQLVGVGRYPVTSAYEANLLVDKLETYMSNPLYGGWRNNVMVIADDGDEAAHLNQAESSIDRMMKNGAGPHFAYDKIYLDSFERKETGSGLTFPDAKERMLMKWQKEGVAFINYIGHANPKSWGHEKMLTWTDISNMSNQYLPVLYAATCSFGKWDAEEISGAEVMLSNPAGGVIAAITPSRTVFISSNEYITNSMSEEFFRRDSLGRGQRLGDIVRIGKNQCSPPSDNMLRYHLFGDPALRMPVSNFNITIDSIAGMPVAAEIADAPSVKARSSFKISGRVTDYSGETVAFNGPLQFTLFDAEKSVTTHGWGGEKPSVYQERQNKLATGGCMAKDGKWETTILMPSEIANNYSPALISVYAYDKTMQAEATGSTDRLFVYGYSDDAEEDDKGPEIELFGVNSLSDKGGQTVHSNPVAMAVFSDESGINISDAAIGHKMSLLLDKEKLYEDVSNYFTPDPDDNRKGSIAYPLLNLEPGNHELTFTVWDNANNSSYATINFNVGLNLRPDVTEISTYYDRNNDRLTMTVSTDRPLCTLTCRLECFDLGGQLKWQTERKVYSGSDSTFSYAWDLKDINGNRMPRGIYMLRAVVESEDGLASSESKKIAIPAK
ncbi:MAG: type IX secretion system sortase PorU [Muribaculaceae bacterium]|nr:type IX secretion system sortase PorU [Muribaculaceae bacterium]